MKEFLWWSGYKILNPKDLDSKWKSYITAPNKHNWISWNPKVAGCPRWCSFSSCLACLVSLFLFAGCTSLKTKNGLNLKKYHRCKGKPSFTLQGTNISPKNGILKMIFLFPRWDMLIPWRVNVQHFFFWGGESMFCSLCSGEYKKSCLVGCDTPIELKHPTFIDKCNYSSPLGLLKVDQSMMKRYLGEYGIWNIDEYRIISLIKKCGTSCNSNTTTNSLCKINHQHITCHEQARGLSGHVVILPCQHPGEAKGEMYCISYVHQSFYKRIPMK